MTTGNRPERLFGVTVVPGSGLRVAVEVDGVTGVGDGALCPTTAVMEVLAWETPGAATAMVRVACVPAVTFLRMRAAIVSFRVLFARRVLIVQVPTFEVVVRRPGQSANLGAVIVWVRTEAVAWTCRAGSVPRMETT